MQFRFVCILFFLPAIIFAQQFFQPRVDSIRPAFSGSVSTVPPDSLVHVIIEFRETPLFIMQRSSSAASMPDYEKRFQQFLQDLQATAAGSLLKGTPSVSLQRTFYRTFFGVSAVLPSALSLAAADLPYVKKVHRNTPVRASLHKSIPQIRANEVWTNNGSRGEGVTVGIVDSGIDYLHPALGGAFGPGAKVVGGYDFYNNDNDPMDDNGHGTHVAGIVAADASDVKGVAPKAKLYAFKVLGAEGGGMMDDIIAAVERCVDPNNDGNMNDRLDIVNMSLGSERGEPDDAPSVAVDNAVSLGVTFVIAAGNSGFAESFPGKEGNYYYSGLESIGSPGTSRSAITVGAIDSLNSLAYFSSKGPTPGEYGIKPDVVAPGVNIRSLFPGNSMLVESGTSMASPMVAGVAALLKSIEPALTPGEIKSKIVNAAVDLGLKPVHQGGGRIDAVRAAALSTVAEPVHLNFGLDDPAADLWSTAETVKVINRKNISQTYNTVATGGVNGISLSASPSNFTLASGGMQLVIVTITVNNSIIPIVNDDIKLHHGGLKIMGSADTVRLPWMFARTTRMLLKLSHADAYFLGMSENAYFTPHYDRMFSRVRQIDPKTWEVSGAPMESFDFGIHFRGESALVLKKDLPFDGAETFSFNASEAVHSVIFGGVDQNNVPLSSSGKSRRSLRVNMPKGSMFASFPAGATAIKVSSVGAEYTFHPTQALIDLSMEKRIVLPQYPVFAGISGDVTITNPSTEFIHQRMRFITPDGVDKTRFFSEVISLEQIAGEDYFNTSIVHADTVNVSNNEVEFDLYMMPAVDSVHSASVAFHTNSAFRKDQSLDMSTRYLTVVNDSILLGLPSQRTGISYLSPHGGTLNFGEAPVYVLNLSYNNSFGPSIHFNPIYFGSMFEYRYSDVNTGRYSIFNEAGTLLKDAPLNDFPRGPFPAELKPHSLVLTSHGFSVKNVKGTLTLRNHVDLSKTIADAPIFTSLIIMNEAGNAVSGVKHGDNATVRFSSKVLSFPSQIPLVDSTKVWYRYYRGTDWIPLTVSLLSSSAEKEGALFSASLSPATSVDSVGIELRIRTVDKDGNSADMTIAPAFSVGNWSDNGTTDMIDRDVMIPGDFSLAQNYPNPFNPVTNISYSVPYAGMARLSVYDLLGREIAVLANGPHEQGNYSLQFNAAQLSSGVYLYRLSIAGNTLVRKMMVLK